MNIVKLCGTAILIIALIFVLRNTKKDYSTFISLLFGVIVFQYVLTHLSKNSTLFKMLFENNILGEYGSILLKVIGVTLLVDSASDICTDAGEHSIASKIETAGKIEILVLSFPIINKILLILEETIL